MNAVSAVSLALAGVGSCSPIGERPTVATNSPSPFLSRSPEIRSEVLLSIRLNTELSSADDTSEIAASTASTNSSNTRARQLTDAL